MKVTPNLGLRSIIGAPTEFVSSALDNLALAYVIYAFSAKAAAYFLNIAESWFFNLSRISS
jgi:hypothetical protein